MQQIKKKKPVRVALTKGSGTPTVVLDIAPTMKNITHQGERYFRMDKAWHICDDGEWASLYLWDGWMESEMAKHKASKEAAPTVP